MTELSKNNQVPQCDKTAVKCRFFAQYYGQEILRWHQWVEKTPDSKVDLSIPAIEKSGWFIKLKPLSKITDEDAMVIQKITDANHLPKQPLIYACLKKSDAIPVIDYLRSKGYAVPFMEYSVEDLIEFDWVRLV